MDADDTTPTPFHILRRTINATITTTPIRVRMPQPELSPPPLLFPLFRLYSSFANHESSFSLMLKKGHLI
jgi:streptomycin 6-kinase